MNIQDVKQKYKEMWKDNDFKKMLLVTSGTVCFATTLWVSAVFIGPLLKADKINSENDKLKTENTKLKKDSTANANITEALRQYYINSQRVNSENTQKMENLSSEVSKTKKAYTKYKDSINILNVKLEQYKKAVFVADTAAQEIQNFMCKQRRVR